MLTVMTALWRPSRCDVCEKRLAGLGLCTRPDKGSARLAPGLADDMAVTALAVLPGGLTVPGGSSDV